MDHGCLVALLRKTTRIVTGEHVRDGKTKDNTKDKNKCRNEVSAEKET